MKTLILVNTLVHLYFRSSPINSVRELGWKKEEIVFKTNKRFHHKSISSEIFVHSTVMVNIIIIYLGYNWLKLYFMICIIFLILHTSKRINMSSTILIYRLTFFAYNLFLRMFFLNLTVKVWGCG